jgi:type II secretory pathway predicted ATPase ExeA
MKAIDKIKNFFGLIKMPFTNCLSVGELYISSCFHEAYSRLSLALETESITVITGDTGCGKSSLLRYFTHNLDSLSFKVIYVPTDSNTRVAEIAKQALYQLQMEVPYNSQAAVRKLKDSIVKLNNEKNIKPVLIIDEAHELPLKTMLSLKPLLNYQMDSQNYLFTILSGQTPLNDLLELYPLESLNRRIRIRYNMQLLSLSETSEYITHQMKTCGLDRTLFPDEVKARLFELTKGNIAEINELCFNLVIHAAAGSKEIIELGMLDVVQKNKIGEKSRNGNRNQKA